MCDLMKTSHRFCRNRTHDNSFGDCCVTTTLKI
nr:MAG TPA: hypothetical protein [Caudoviricetes sp.]